ncbi:MAG TPA: hypothetical protein VN764_06370, partial [Polyangiaceae bacterium]|nr:hypothetical protein [Polyangiaceae bacterium]
MGIVLVSANACLTPEFIFPPDGGLGGANPEPSCSDDAQSPGETDIDCGGVCGPTCGIDQRCEKDTDCTSDSCQARRCVAASCIDNKQNNGETDIDCGGSLCSGTCEVGERCLSNSDCLQPK